MFFKNKFQEEEWVRPKLDGVSFKAIGQQHNDRLTRPFTEKEIKDAMWEVIKVDMLCFMAEFFVHGTFPKGCNASFIALIPKVNNSQNLNDYRPISLIGSIYKIVAKVLARRLRRCGQY